MLFVFVAGTAYAGQPQTNYIAPHYNGVTTNPYATNPQPPSVPHVGTPYHAPPPLNTNIK
jgi:hypothetical protein